MTLSKSPRIRPSAAFSGCAPTLLLWMFITFPTPFFPPDQAMAAGESRTSQNHAGMEAPYIQLTGVTDIRSKFSDGCNSVKRLAEMSVKRGIDVMILTDHDRYSLEYGIFPFRGIIKKKVEESSLLKNGADNYLKAIANLQYDFNDLIAIPGVESAPFYYWTGGVLSKDLTAHLWENHLGIYGMQNPADYEGLPTLNSNLSMRYFGRFFKGFLLFSLSALTGLVMISFGAYFRIAGIVVLVLNLLLMVSYHPFRSSPFDQYHGPQGVKPWQMTINYANEHGGLVFWHHLESSSGIGRKKFIYVNTPPHPRDLLLTHGYTGFQAVYDDTITVTEPGHEWDQALLQYLRGERDRAPWGIGGHDFHCEGTSGIHFDDVKTVFLVKHKDRDAVLRAMRKGRMYAVRQPRGRYRLSLDAFTIHKKDGSKKAFMGEAVPLSSPPELHIKISETSGKPKKFTLTVVRSGEVIKKMTSTTPLDLHYTDPYFEPGQTVFYRLKAVAGQGDYLVSNPIFVLFHEREGPENAREETPAPSSTEEPTPPAPAEKAAETRTETPKKETSVTAETDKAAVPALPDRKSPGAAGQETAGRKPEPTKAPPVATRNAAAPPRAGEKEKRPPKRREKPRKMPFIIVRKESVNLRGSPGIHAKKLRRVRKGARLRLVEVTKAVYKKIPWLKVLDDRGRNAYIWGGLVVSEGKENASQTKAAAGRTRVVILRNGVTLRKGPGRRYPEVRKLSRGEEFSLVKTTGALYRHKPWLKISGRNGKTGYVWSDLVKKVKNK